MKKMDKSLHGVYFSPDMFPIMGSEPKTKWIGGPRWKRDFEMKQKV